MTQGPASWSVRQFDRQLANELTTRLWGKGVDPSGPAPPPTPDQPLPRGIDGPGDARPVQAASRYFAGFPAFWSGRSIFT